MTKIKTNRNFINQAKENKKNKNNNSVFRHINKALLFLIMILGIYYIAGINDLSIKSFELSALKMNVKDLTTENGELNVKMMSMESFNNLNKRVGNLNMVAAAAEEIAYIAAPEQAVAKK